MIDANRNDGMEAGEVRERKKALIFLREAFQTEKQHLSEKIPKKKHELQALMSSMRVNRLKNAFYKKLTMSNIFQQPTQIDLVSEQDKDNKRWLKWKGLYVHAHILSIIYLLEMIFLIVTFLISSWMAFLDNFVQSKAHECKLVIFLNAITLILSCIKFLITSTSQRIRKGILMSYMTDIFLDYAKSFALFVDLIYIFVLMMLFIVRDRVAHLIEEWSLVLFICSIIRIAISSQNLTLFRTTFINSSRKDQYYKLFQVIFFNLIFAHFIASILFAMADINPTANWMYSKHIQHELWYVQYMWGYYWATTTMMTVGFGDFIPVTHQQGFIVAFLQFFSCIVLAYNISEIGGVISSIRSSQNEYIAKIAVFKRMAQQNQIDLELKLKIEGYLRQERAIKEKFEFTEQNQLLEELPLPLKKQFIMTSNSKLFKYLPFFKNLQKNTLLHLTEVLTSKVYYPSEILSKANQYNEKIMILKDGKIGLEYRKMDSSLNGIIVEQVEIKNRQFFNNEGQKEFKSIPILLTVQFLSPGKVVNYDMTAMKYSYVFELTYQNFLDVIKMSDIDTEYFFSTTQQHSPTGNQWEQLPCQICMQKFTRKNQQNAENDDSEKLFYHTKFECPKLHFIPLRSVIVYKFLTIQGEIQQRKKIFHRLRQKSDSCLMLRKYAYKTYERRRLIHQKRGLEKLIQRSLSNLTSKSLKKNNKGSQRVLKRSKRKGSDNISGYQRKQFVREESRFAIEKRYTEGKNHENYSKIYQFDQMDVPNQNLESQECEISVIESVIKTTMEEMVHHYVEMNFWDLQIDAMANYFNYFPQQNAAKMDNLELCKDKSIKNKGMCLIGQILTLRNIIKNNNQQKEQKDQLNEKSNQNQAITKFLSIFTTMKNQQNGIKNIKGISSEEINSSKVYQNQEKDVINDQKIKYQQRYSMLAYHFPRPQRTTEDTVRENIRIELSPKNQELKMSNGIDRASISPKKSLNDSRIDLIGQSRNQSPQKTAKSPNNLVTFSYLPNGMKNSKWESTPFFGKYQHIKLSQSSKR